MEKFFLIPSITIVWEESLIILPTHKWRSKILKMKKTHLRETTKVTFVLRIELLMRLPLLILRSRQLHNL